MKYMREIAKIAEFGMKGDIPRVTGYLRQLTEKLKADGDLNAANCLCNVLDKSVAMVSTSGSHLPKTPIDTESRLALADTELVDPRQVPIVLEPPARKLIDEFITFVQKADQLEAYGIGVAPSLIMSGPPGSGKTQLARFIAGSLGMPIVTARADTLISSFLGSTSKNLRQLFDHVAHTRCVLFLDEIDAFAKLRDDVQEMGELKRVVVSLLQNIDAMDRSSIFLAATNHEHLLDPAIWRRFTYKLELAYPGLLQREELFSLYLGTFSDNADIKMLSAVSATLSGADIRILSENAIRETVLADRKVLDERKLLARIIRQRIKLDLPCETTAQNLNAVRALAPKYFTGIKLAELFETSASNVCRKLKEGGNE